MGTNKITNCSYFIKRLRDCGYIVDRVFDKYHESDPRNWTIILDPGVASVLITCVTEPDGEYFEFHDGGRFIPANFHLNTSSIEVVVYNLVNFGINNKAPSYHGG